jgi:two-component system sensor histidine kinase/response regulator
MIKPQKTMQELIKENRMLRREIKVTREAADITARLVVRQFEKTEQSLHRTATANSQRQAILEAATQLSIIATDLSGKINLFNQGAENLLGYGPGEMMGQPVDRIHLLSELRQYAQKLAVKTPDVPAAVMVFDQHVKQQIVHASEWTYLCKNGTHLPVNLSVTAFYSARGTMKGYLFTAMDMSSQKQMQQELIQAMEAAESANASKGDFLARMSHEIRTPMNGIIGMAYLMEKTSLSRTQKNYLNKILSSAKTLLNLINDILDFSKIDAGKLTLETIEFQLEDVLVDLYNTIGFQAEEKGLEFLFHMDDSLPLKLVGDPLRLGQILINLAGNAIKFTQSGEIIISVTGEKVLTGPDQHSATGDTTHRTGPHAPDGAGDLSRVMLTFSVKDSGIGLAPDQLDHLFEAFSQADGSITRKYGGTGLGLSICSQLIQMMGGQIRVDSTPQKGTTFTFTAMMQYTTGRQSSVRLTKARFQGLRALVVDDNQMARQLLGSMLTSFHMQVDTASDGKTALARLKKAVRENRPYDVILLDWLMPQMDGIETARRIHRDKTLAKIPAMLMVTASNREQARQKGGKSGINAFLTKPVYPSVMFDTLIRVLDTQDRSEDLSGPAQPVTRPSQGQMTGAKILLAEDNPINQEVAAGLLMDMGVEVDIAGNGLICLEKLEKNVYDLVLMDIQMPEMDGLETTRRIRRNPELSDLPVIAMTAHAMTGDRKKSLDAGMNDHITKPVEPAALCEMLQRFLPQDKQPAAGAPAAVPKKPIPLTPSGTGKTTPWKPETTLPADLPVMSGIDPDQALAHVTPAMLIKLMYDFKRTYQDLPEKISACQAGNDLETLRTTAHTLKGVAGYIGALPLQQAAGELETCLKQNPAGPSTSENTLPAFELILQGFVTNLQTVLNSLDLLPPVPPTAGQPVSGDRDPLDGTGEAHLLPLTEKDKKVMQHFSDLLSNGELTAEEMLPDIHAILTRCGFHAEWTQIREKMDEIEYDAAAHIINRLLE